MKAADVRRLAPRIRKPSAKDPRLLAGCALVAASTCLGAWAVPAALNGSPVWAANGTLVAGEPLRRDQLTIVQATTGGGNARYMSADTEPPSDLVMLRTVGAGELIPLAAVGSHEELEVRSVAVPVSGALSSRVAKGARVDVWFVPTSRPASDARPQGPEQIAREVDVEQVDTASGLAVGASATVHVLVPVGSLPKVLSALAADGNITVVPVGAPQ